MRISGIILLVFIVATLAGCLSIAERFTEKVIKINGVSFTAARSLIDSTDLVSVKEINASWVSLMPYGFVREAGTEVQYSSNWQWAGETPDGIIEDIKLVKQQGLKVMLKPHIWISHGNYTGDFMLEGEVDWQKFEKSYKKYILEFASIAEDQKVEMFCIGTEWRKFIKERPQFWESLIKEVGDIYSGELTYAANWDEFKETPFWRQLDYIGVNAYFPLTNKDNPSLEEVAIGWSPVTNQLKNYSLTQERPILFTEYGYRSIEGTTIRPWESYTDSKVSMLEQELALEALFKNNWDGSWLAGGFLWKWFSNHDDQGGTENTGYTPQNKPAEMVIKEYYDIEK